MTRASRQRARLLIASLCVSAASFGHAYAQQTGFKVVSGQATLSTPKPGTAIVTQTTPKAVIDWQSLSVPSGSALIFQEPSVSAITLNTVLGPGASFINGTLSSIGQIWIVNPNGVVFGRNSTVNVGGLIASASGIRAADFMAGDYDFATPGNPNARVVNRGRITAVDGGSVVLAGPVVGNHGYIQASLGTVALASGGGFSVDFQGDHLLSFAVTTPLDATPVDAKGKPASALVSNDGTIGATGGQILLTQRAAQSVVDNVLNLKGVVEANSAHVENGAIVIDAGPNGTANVSGTVDASGKAAGLTGGNVAITGGTVALNAGALIDASGDVGGGTVAIGGNMHGAGPLANARSTSVAPGAKITANAISNGNGGTVAVWSDGNTTFNGAITVAGGAAGGNGGSAETSGAGTLNIYSGTVDASAPRGTPGSWLLDPNSNVNITSATANVTCTGSVGIVCTPTADSSTLSAATIQSDLNAGDSVTITTNDVAGSQPGNITISSAIAVTGSTASTFTLSAAGSVTVNAAVTTTAAPMNVNFASSGSGGVTIAANVTTDGGSFSASALATAGITVNSGASVSTLGSSGSKTLTLSTGSGGSIAVNGGVSAGTSATIATGTGGSFSMGGSGASIAVSGANALTIETDNLSVASGSTISGGTGLLTVATAGQGTSIGIGTGAGAFQVSETMLAAISGFGSLTIGNINQGNSASGLMTIAGGVSFPAPTTLDSSGPVSISNAVSVPAAQSLTLNSGIELGCGACAGGGAVTFASGSSVSSGSLAVGANGGVVSDGASYISTASAVSSFSLNAAGSGNGVSLTGAVTAGSFPLNVALTAGSGGTVTVGGAVTTKGGTFAASALGTGGAIAVNAAVSASSATFVTGAGGSFGMGGSGSSVTVTGGNSLTIEADSLSIASGSALSGGTGQLVFETVGQGTNIGIGTGAGTLQVTSPILSAISGFGTLLIGDINQGNSASGTMTVAGGVSFPATTTLDSSGPINISNSMAVPAAANLTLVSGVEIGCGACAGSGAITLAGGSAISAASLAATANSGAVNFGASFTDTATSSANFNLSATGAGNGVSLTGAVTAGSSALGVSLTAGSGATVTIGGAVTTKGGGLTVNAPGTGGAIAVNAAVSAGSATFTTGASGSFSMAGAGSSVTVSASNSMVVQTDTLSIASGSVISGGAGSLIFETTQQGTSIGIGTGPGAFQVNSAALASISGFNALTIGNDYQNLSAAPTMTVSGGVSFPTATTLNSAGPISLSNSVSVPAGLALTLNSGSEIGCGFCVAGGAITFLSGTTLSAGSILATAGNGLISDAANFTDTATASTSFSLSTIGTGGNVSLSGAVTAGTAPLTVALSSTAGNVTIGTAVNTNGGSLAATAISGSIAVNGAVSSGGTTFTTGSGGAFSMGGGGSSVTVAGGSGVTIKADALSIASGSVLSGGTGSLVFETVQQGTSIGIGTGTGSFQVNGAALASITGFSSLTIGNAYQNLAAAPTMTIAGGVSFPLATTLDSAGPISVSNSVSVPAGLGLTLNTGAEIGCGFCVAGGALTAASGATLSAGSFAATAFNGSLSYAASFTDTATASSNFNLSSSGTGGGVSLTSAISAASFPLNVSLSSSAGSVTIGASVATNGGTFSATANGAGGSVTEALGVTVATVGPSGGKSVAFSASGSGGSVAVNGSVNAGAGATFTAGAGGTFSMGGSGSSVIVPSNSGVTIQADALSIASGSAISGGTGALIFETAQQGTSIGIGTGTGTFQLTAAELTSISGFGSLTIGNIYQNLPAAPTMTVSGGVSFPTATTLDSAGPISVSNSVSVPTGLGLTLNTGAEIGCGFCVAGGTLTLASGTTLSAGSLAATAFNGALSYAASFTDTAAASSSFSLSATGTGTGVALNSAVAAVTAPLNVSLQSSAGSVTVGASVATNGGTFSASGVGATIAGAVAAGSSATVVGGSGTVAIGGSLSTTAGSIIVTSANNITVTAPIAATGGNVTVDDHTGVVGVGVSISNTTVRAQSTASDGSTTGSTIVTGSVSTAGSTISAGAGRTVTLEGPAGNNVIFTNSMVDTGDLSVSPGQTNDVIFNANTSLTVNAGSGQAGNISIFNVRNITMNAGSSIQADGGLTIGGASGAVTGNVVLNTIVLDHNGDGNGASGTVGLNASNIAGTLTLNGTVSSASSLFSGVTLAATGGVTVNAPINIASGTVTLNSAASLASTITTSGGAVAFNAPVTLAGNVAINTAGTGAPSGANVSFNSSLAGASAYADNLAIAAGSSGNIAFSSAIGTRLGAVTISSANAVAMGGSFSAASLTIAGPGSTPGAATLTASAGINTAGATSATAPTNGGAVAILTSGAVSIAGAIVTSGGVNSTTNIGGNGGAVTINAGGAVQLGSALNPATNSAIFTEGFTAGSGQTAGSGGNISVAGASINLFSTAITDGGSATASGALGTGGLSGTISLTTTAGDLTASSTAFPTTPVFIDAYGGGSTPSNDDLGLGNSIAIHSAGNATVTGGIATSGGGNGGPVTISAVGAVQLGSLLNPAAISAIYTDGVNAASGQSAGNGGVISVSGASISLFADVGSQGGASTAAGAIGAGGTAGAVTLTTTSGDLTIASTAFPSTPVYLFANGGASGTGNGGNGGNGGTVIITSAGSVTMSGALEAAGGVAGGSGVGGNGGTVTIGANGAVAIGTGETLIARYTGNLLASDVASIVSRGANTVTSTSQPGNGGPITISGTSINLPFGLSSVGGFAVDTASSSNGVIGWASTAITGWLGPSTASGGNGGAISVTGSGPVVIGNPAGSPATSTGDLVGLSSVGGASTGGSGGSAGAVSVTGTTVSLARINADGGDTLAAAAAAGGAGANIQVIALSAVPGAITLYGDSDLPAVVTPSSNTSLSSRGGFIDLSAFGTSAAPAVVNGQAGNLALQVPNGGSITLATSTTNTTITGTATTGTTTLGSNVITGVASTAGLANYEWISGPGIPADTAIVAISGSTIILNQAATASGAITLTPLPVPNGVNAGSTIELSASGGFNDGSNTALGGTLMLIGPVEASTTNVESLRISAGDGTASIAGAVGDQKALNSLVFGSGINTASPPGGNGGSMTLAKPVTVATQLVDLRNSGSLVFAGVVSTPSFTPPGGTAAITFGGGASLGSGVTFSNTGILSLTGNFQIAGAVAIAGSVALVGNVSVDTSAGNGGIALGGAVNGVAAGGQSLALSAGSGAITINGAVGATKAPGGLSFAGGTIALDAAINVGAGSFVLTSSGSVTQTQPITAGALDLLGAGGHFVLSNAANAIGTVAASTGSVAVTDAAALSVGVVGKTSGVTATGPVSLISAGNLTLLDGVNGGGTGTTVTLGAGAAFTNDDGGAAVTAGSGRWLIYSQNPAADNDGGLVANFKQYDAAFPAAPAQSTGNGLLYALNPSLTVELTGTVSKTYNGTNAATLAPGNYTLLGAQGGDTITFTEPTSGLYATANAGSGITVSVSGLAITSVSNGGETIYGYQLGSSLASGAVGVIAPLAVTLSGNRLYDATPNVSGGILSVGNLVGGDALTLGGTASVASKNVGAESIASFGGLTLGGASSGNYTLAGASGSVTITPAPLTLTAATNSKIYDGTVLASATPSVSGLKGSDTVSGAGESYIGKNAGTGLTLTVNGGFTVNDGNGGSDYAVTTASNASGAITPATLTYIADPASMTVGGTVPSLSGTVTGFVPGENAGNATGGALSFTTPASSSSPAGSYAINGSGLTANNGNYVFVQAPGNATALTIGSAFATIAGTVFSDRGLTLLPGASVVLLVNGTNEGSVTSGANGLYDFSLGSGVIPPGGAEVLVYLGGGGVKGNSFYDGATGSIANLDIYGNYVRLLSGRGTLSGIAGALATAVGSNANANLLFSIGVNNALTPSANLEIVSRAPALTIDQALNVGSANLVLNSNGTVTQSQPLTAGGLDLQGAGGSYVLTNAANSIATVAANTGSVNLADGGSLSVGTVEGTSGIAATGAVSLAATGVSLADNITTVGGAVTLSTPVLLRAAVLIDTTGSGTAPAGAAISLAGTLDSATAAAENFTATAGDGAITLAGNVGAAHPLGTLSLISAGVKTLAGSVVATDVMTDATGGTTVLAGGSITTTGQQNFEDAVILAAPTTLQGNDITFTGPIDGPFNLTTQATTLTTFGGPVGQSTALSSLTVASAAQVDGGAVTTTGVQNWNGPVTTFVGAAPTALDGSAVNLQGTTIGAFIINGNIGGPVTPPVSPPPPTPVSAPTSPPATAPAAPPPETPSPPPATPISAPVSPPAAAPVETPSETITLPSSTTAPTATTGAGAIAAVTSSIATQSSIVATSTTDAGAQSNATGGGNGGVTASASVAPAIDVLSPDLAAALNLIAPAAGGAADVTANAGPIEMLSVQPAQAGSAAAALATGSDAQTGAQSEPGSDTDQFTASISLGSTPAGPRNNGRSTTGNRTIISGVLVQAPTQGAADDSPRGVPPTDESYSSWGNEALWQ